MSVINSTVRLNIDYKPSLPEEKHPNDFGYTLFEEQLQVLYLMNNLEQQKSIEHVSSNGKLCAHYNTLRLGACLSFGKSIVTLALIKLNTQPLKREWYTIFDNHRSTVSGINSIAAKVIRKYYINTNLLVVSQSVYHQWVQHAKVTKLKVLGVETNVDFRSLCILFINDKAKLEEYDIILMIYRHLPDMSLPFGASKHIPNYDKRTTINVLSLLSMNMEWKRVIIDDYDTINIGHDMCIPARMTWLISTTKSYGSNRYKLPQTITDITSINHKIIDNSRDLLIGGLTIQADLDIKARILPQIQHTIYTFLDAYMLNRIVNDMQYSTDVVERLNSGDISGAATALGITVQCNTNGEFLSCILEKNKTAYYESITTCRRFEHIVQTLRDNQLFVENTTPNRTPLCDLCERVSAATDEEFDIILNTLIISHSDGHQLNVIVGRARANVTRCTHILDRLKRNVEGGECQKCLLEPEGPRYILKCCNIVLCQECMTLPNKTFIGRCPNCISVVEKGGVVEVPEAISLEQFLEYDIDNAIDDIDKYHKEHKEQLTIPAEAHDPDRHLSAKDRALLAIVQGTEPTNAKSIDSHRGLGMENILESENYIEQDPERPNKYLVFTKHAACANELHDVMKARGINSVILRGTNKVIVKSIQAFKTSPDINVMFMYSTAYCAGLNLEFATHMIFYHSIMDRSTTTQLIGRAQRLGRKESLKLIYLKNKGERYL